MVLGGGLEDLGFEVEWEWEWKLGGMGKGE